MKHQFYRELAAASRRMPLGTGVVLREKPDPDAVLLDGEQLGLVLAETARRHQTSLAVPVLDLTVERTGLLQMLDVPADQMAGYRFPGTLDSDLIRSFGARLRASPTGRWKARVEAIAYIARQTDLVPVGLSVGPFSLMTTLLAEPGATVARARTGRGAQDDEQINALEQALDFGLRTVLCSIATQLAAGAQVVIVCEPAVNQDYFPAQQPPPAVAVLDRYVLGPNRHLNLLLAESVAELVYWDGAQLIKEDLEDLLDRP